MMLVQTDKAIINPSKSAIGLKTAFNIFAKWGCSNEQMQSILRVSRAAFYKYREQPASARLNDDQLERISYILNIHGALRVVFSNPENVYGYMKMANDNSYFSGKSPLELISSGSFASLYEVFKQVDAMRSGQW